MKRFLAIVLSLLFALSAPGLADTGAEDADIELIGASGEMLDRMLVLTGSPAYSDLYSSSTDIRAVTDEILANDYTKPEKTIVIAVDSAYLKNTLEALNVMMGLNIDSSLFNDDVFHMLGPKLLNAIPSLLNGREGVTWLAAQSILNAQDVIRLQNTENAVVFVLRFYGEDRPSAYVSFSVKGDGLTLVNAGFVKIPEDILNMLFDGGVTQYLATMGFVDDDQFRIRVYEGTGE